MQSKQLFCWWRQLGNTDSKTLQSICVWLTLTVLEHLLECAIPRNYRQGVERSMLIGEEALSIVTSTYSRYSFCKEVEVKRAEVKV